VQNIKKNLQQFTVLHHKLRGQGSFRSQKKETVMLKTLSTRNNTFYLDHRYGCLKFNAGTQEKDTVLILGHKKRECKNKQEQPRCASLEGERFCGQLEYLIMSCLKR
jgi:hypothetical protein